VCAILEDHGIVVLGCAREGDEAAALIALHKPAVALIDLRMPRLNGIEVTRRAQRSSPGTGILLYTAFGEGALLTEALDAGARGFLLKEAPLEDLIRAVETVAGGGLYVDAVLAGAIAATHQGDRVPILTQREREVLRLLADGHANEEIGRRLFISPETVRTHVRKAMAKLEAETRTHAVATALRRSIIA
jgi:DNA-binding NarL/FixJ family response regulator